MSSRRTKPAQVGGAPVPGKHPRTGWSGLPAPRQRAVMKPVASFRWKYRRTALARIRCESAPGSGRASPRDSRARLGSAGRQASAFRCRPYVRVQSQPIDRAGLVGEVPGVQDELFGRVVQRHRSCQTPVRIPISAPMAASRASRKPSKLSRRMAASASAVMRCERRTSGSLPALTSFGSRSFWMMVRY
jgi:hypothetical protein